jgi:hypothetical protein
MRFKQWCALAFMLGLGASVHADPDNVSDNWSEARSLGELPAGVRTLLGVGRSGRDGIADQGGPFNAGDVIVDDTPQRRFALGIANDATVVVAVEHGGIGYRVEVLEFHQVDALWEPVRCALRGDVPRHGDALLATLAASAPQAEASCRMVDGHVAVAPRRAPAVAPGPPSVRPQPRA